MNYRELHRLYELDGSQATVEHVGAALQSGELQPADFSLRELAEAVVPDGREWVRSLDPRGGYEVTEADGVGNLIEKLELPRNAAFWVIDSGDPGFTRFVGTPTDVNQPSDYGGDSLLISPPAGGGNPEMVWKFDGLEPGAYRVLASWSGQPTATTSVVFRISDYYNESTGLATASFFPLDPNEDVGATGAGSQRIAAGDLLRHESGVWTGWKELSSSFVIGPEGPGSLGVHFTVGNNQPIHADAIRIERIARRTSYKYDALNRLVEQVDNANGVGADRDAAVTHYDAAGNVVKVEENPGVDPRQIVALYRYDALGQLIEQTDQGLVNGQPETRTARFQYDAAGNQTAAIDPLHRMSRSEYDRLDRLVKSTDPDPDGSGPLLPHATTSVYDPAGNLLSQTNGANQTEKFAYDLQGRLVRSEDGRGDVTRRVYDAAGNLSKLIDPADNATTYAYDGLDRKIEETTAAGTRRFIYDANGNLFYAVDRNGRTSRFSYDSLDRVTVERWYVDLNAAQNLTTQWTAAFEKFYDELGRLVREQSSQKDVVPGPVTYWAVDSFRYDNLDRVIEHSNQNLLVPAGPHSTGPALHQTYAYAYDANGLVETREQFVGGAFAASTKSSYNAFGELARLQDSDVGASGASAILDFEAADAVFTYLGDGSLASTMRYTDWDAALPGGAGHRNHVTTTYGYDGAGRIKNISHAQSRRTTDTWPANTPLVAFAYGYDAAGRIDSIGTDWNQALTAFSNRTDETQAFDFDDAGQLEIVDSNLANRDANYNYGANGNRTSATEPVGASNSYQTGADNRVSQDSTYTYEYDDEGNLERRQLLADPDYYVTYAWDHRNRLTKVERHDGTTQPEVIAYRYNAAGDLVYRSYVTVGATQVEHYLVESGQRTLTFEQDGDVKRRYQYGPTGEVLFDQVFDEAGNPNLQAQYDLLMPLGDHQHSTRVVVAHVQNAAIQVYQSLDYAPFGAITAVRNSLGQPASSHEHTTAFAFQGMVYDVEAGHYQTAARVYDPRLGRFLSEDPIQDGTNWYMAFGNDPVNYADPSGLFQQGHPLKGGGGKLDNFLRGAVNQALNPARPAQTPFASPIRLADGSATPLVSQRFLNEFGPIAASNQTTARNHFSQVDASLKAGVRPTIPGPAPYSAFTEYLHGVGEVFKGYGDAVVGTAEGLYNVARHPINTVVGVATAVRHPVQTVQAIAADISEKSGTLRGQGAIVGDILTSVATGGAVKAVKEVGVIGKIAAKVPKGIATSGPLPSTRPGLLSTIGGDAIDPADLARMKSAFERNGGSIIQNADSDAYLLWRAKQMGASNVGGLTHNAKEIMLPTNATRTAVFEEFVHTAQFRIGRANAFYERYGNVGGADRLEIEAAEKLISNRKSWQLPNNEVREVIDRLRGLRTKVGQ